MTPALRVALATMAALAAATAQAQVVQRQFSAPSSGYTAPARAPSAAPAAPTATAAPVAPGAPSANGLGSPFAPQLPSLAVPGTSAAGTVPADNAGEDPANYPATAVMGGSGGIGLARPGTGPYSIVDIARSFIQADANRDGELTRVEATRLAILPISFEEMDANHNEILTRSEYEDALR